MEFFGWGDNLTLENYALLRMELATQVSANPVVFYAGFFLVYAAFYRTFNSAAIILTLLAGSLFGFLAGFIVVSFASTSGAVLASLFPDSF